MKLYVCLAGALTAVLIVAAFRTAGGPGPVREQPAGSQPEPAPAPAHEDPFGPNAACYVCHMTFVGEPLTRSHMNANIGCIECHGVSAGHANDENIGATPPDRAYDRGQVNDFCRTCHAAHDVAPEKLIAEWSRRRQRGWVTETMDPPAVCTDCHGEHRIAG